MSPLQLHELMLESGIVVSPGGCYFPNLSDSKYFRVSIARRDKAEIEEGISRIGKAFQRMSQEI